MSYSSNSMPSPQKRESWGICCRSEEMVSELCKVEKSMNAHHL